MLDDLSESTPVSNVMSTKLYTIPLYSDVHIAARLMRNHNSNLVIVSKEQKIVSVLSAHDFLQLVKDYRFVMKNQPTASKKKSKRI